MPVLDRHTHQLGDDDERQLRRAQRDEVALALGQGLLDDVVTGLLDAFLEPRDHSWREAAVDQLTRPGVLGRVLVEHEHSLLVDLLLRVLVEHRRLLVRREQLGIAGDVDHVGVPRQRPIAVRQLRVVVPEDRRLLTEPLELLVGHTGLGVLVQVVDVDVQIGHQTASRPE